MTTDDAASSRSGTLVLVPTRVEMKRIEGYLDAGSASLALAGFGPIAAAARSAELIARVAPRRVLLLGVAGSFDERRWAVGSAACFESVAVTGIGLGEGADHRPASELGFLQWPGETSMSGPAGKAIAERLPLCCAPAQGTDITRLPLLLTSCAASADEAEAKQRRQRFPQAAAEDMEAFGVALACALAGVPLSVLRGCSNAVGRRGPGHWKLEPALEAVGLAARAWLAASKSASRPGREGAP
jgi:futalosine hydrolase